MRLIPEPDPIQEYAQTNLDIIVVPITRYVKRDGSVTVVSELAKEIEELVPHMSKIFGYMLSLGVEYPVIRRSKLSVMGMPTKEHYMSNVEQTRLENGLWYIQDMAFNNPDKILYVPLIGLAREEEQDSINRYNEILGNQENVVVLNYAKMSE